MKNLFGIFGILSVAAMLAFTNASGPGLSVGDTAPDFNLQNAVTGEWESLDSYADAKGYIVIFTCNTCPYAVFYEDRIIELQEKFAPQGYPVIAINPNDPEVKEGDSFEAMKIRAEEKDFTFSYLFDAKQEVFPAYGATKTPHVFILNKERVVKYIGAIDNNPKDAAAADEHFVQDAIMALESGKDPDPSSTKAIGCSIKVKS